MKSVNRINKDKIIALLMPACFIVFGIWMLAESMQMKTMLGTFPSIVGVLTIGLGVIQFIGDLMSPKDHKIFDNSNPIQVAIALGGLAVYVFLLKKIGYIIDTSLLSLFVMTQLGYKNWKVSMPVAVIFTIATFVVFRILLRVHLPVLFLNL